MQNWLKENWFKVGVLVVIFLVGLSFAYYVSFLPQKKQGTKDEITNTMTKVASEQDEKLTFDIDISSLSYQLPPYTKICLPETKQHCSEADCEPIKPTVFILYDENNNMMYRCDNKPCDGYEVERKESGLFTVLEPIEPRAFSVKLSFDDKYTETVGFLLDTLISYGTCK